MAYDPHIKVKSDQVLDAGVAALEDRLVVSHTVTKMNDITNFNQKSEDHISVRVPKPLPVRTYAPRNDRSQPIRTDVIGETVVDVTFTRDRPVSSVELTDEQYDWDLLSWAPIIDRQTDAIGQFLEHQTLNHIVNAPYEVVIPIDLSKAADLQAKNQDVFFNAFVAASKALKRLRNPDQSITALVGLNVAEQIRINQKLLLNQGTGDNALASSTLGQIAGITLVESTHINPDEVYIYAKSSVVEYTGVSKIPTGAIGSTGRTSTGIALRHLFDYDSAYFVGRSTFDLYTGYGLTKDLLVIEDQQGIGHHSNDTYFTRGVKLVMVATDAAAKAAAKEPVKDSELGIVYNLGVKTVPMPKGKPAPFAGNFPAKGGDGSGEG